VTRKSVMFQSISKMQLYYRQNNSHCIRHGFRHNIVTFCSAGQLLLMNYFAVLEHARSTVYSDVAP